jgi:hypothetical protein
LGENGIRSYKFDTSKTPWSDTATNAEVPKEIKNKPKLVAHNIYSNSLCGRIEIHFDNVIIIDKHECPKNYHLYKVGTPIATSSSFIFLHFLLDTRFS